MMSMELVAQVWYHTVKSTQCTIQKGLIQKDENLHR